ncbi:methylmalonyl-CoA mutase family protein, partial [Candidatus Neomarinimicrobiota bacterium]
MSNYKKQKKQWQSDVSEAKNREYDFRTVSSLPVDLLYMPENESEDYIEKLGFPGQYPFTRGVHTNMYRGKLWT